jgi:TolB-like protein/thioredoxin-like negative regulator of GroEL
VSPLTELKRRNVPQVAIVYLASAWLLIQVAETLLPIFGQSEDMARPIVIVLAIGFVPALILAWVFEWTPQGLRRDEGVTAPTSRGSAKGADRAIIVLLVLAVGYFAIDKFAFGPDPAASHNRSIIVLPFINISSDPEQEYLGDGMAEELLNLLSKIEEFRVISRSTAWTFKGKDAGVTEIRDKLDVSHVLEGSVRKSGDKVRVTAQLIDARTDTHLWSETYDGPLDDIFELQDRISARIVGELKIRLLDDMPITQEIDGVAYELFLRARYIQRSDNRAAYGDAVAMLEDALKIEPEYIPAMFELAVLVYLAPHENLKAQEQARIRARGIVDRMAEIAPDASYTNAWQSFIASQWENDLEAAAAHLERAIADNPHNPPQVLTRTATLLARLGRPNEAFALARYNSARDPACMICAYMLASVARQTGHYEEAMEYLQGLLVWHSLTPNLAWQLGAASLVAGEPQKAVELFDQFIDDPSGPVHLGRLMALYDLGRTAEFEAEFAAFKEANSNDWEAIARVLAWTHQNDAAFEHLEKMVEQGGPVSASLIKTDLYSRLSTDSRYDAFLEKHGQSEEDNSHIQFDPPYPPAMRVELERLQASIRTKR